MVNWSDGIPKKNNITVFLPSTLLNTEETVMLKTIKFGIFLRYLCIFKVNSVIIYPDNNDLSDLPLISTLFSYAMAPPYLRKYLFKHSNDLKYAGTLFPLNVCSHNPIKVPSSSFIEKYFDVLLDKFIKKYRSSIDLNHIYFGKKYLGNYHDLLLKPEKNASTNTIKRGIVINIPRNDKKTVVFVDPENIFEFEGDSCQLFEYVEVFDSNVPCLLSYKHDYFSSLNYNISKVDLIELLEEYRITHLRIGTSENGVPYPSIDPLSFIHKPLALVFGPSKDGIEGTIQRTIEYRKAQNLESNKMKNPLNSLFDYYLNTIHDQGTETVRLEEAVGISLALFHSDKEKHEKNQ